MKANSLSINIPYSGCNKDCPYCISKMTGYIETNKILFEKNLKKLKRIADNSGVNSVIITGKGEPLIGYKWIEKISKVFDTYPLEIQTNGIMLLYNEKYIEDLYNFGINTIAISIDNYKELTSDEFVNTVKIIKRFGFNIRITINLVPEITNIDVKKYFSFCEEFKIDQISFRKIVSPTNIIFSPLARKTSKWIEDNIEEKIVEKFLLEYKEEIDKKGIKIRDLPFGSTIYMVGNVSTTFFNYCIQDENNDDNIRSLIYYEDGHLSTTWYGSNYGRIF
jgi:molybdenum cofactor biosynthesis enzyme MoaA